MHRPVYGRVVLHALVLAVVLALTLMGQQAHAWDSGDIESAAEEAGVDQTDLLGAVFTTGMEPREYLVAVGELQPPPAPKLSTPDYIQVHSRYGWKAVCVSRIETGSWTAFWNPTPHGRFGEHAQGFFGWLPSTARSVGLFSIMDLDAEIHGFDTMLDRGRGGEFYGLGGWSGRDGDGPCYRR